jgi:PHD/YefM family antitoxin component YafN of YafNO toxin-antitoxin module
MSCMDAARLRRLIGNSERVMERARDAELASARRVNSTRGALEESRARLRRDSAGRQRESPPPSIVTFTM